MPPFRNNNLNNGINNSGLFPESNEISKEEVKDYLLDPIRVLGVSFLSVAMLITILAFVISYTLEYNVTNKKKELENGSVTKEIIGINLEDINNFYNKFRILQNKLQNKNNLFGVIDVLSVAVEENSYFSNFS
ncbi:MAG: hypothetical protein QM532_00995 [Cyanobium sp. MAG06]|nr:hypothetical protein [Cyanobium sp. MAG06]